MGDPHPKNPKSPPLSLPPGFRFHPTDHQILSFYLPNKNNNNSNKAPTTVSPPTYLLDVISDLTNLCDYDPYDLPESDSFPYGYGGNKRHWYYFTASGSRKGAKRKSKGGYWKSKCRIRNVLGDAGLLGTKTSFVFYKRDSSSRRCCRTNWMMIEYALLDHQMDFFVLCRVFLKTCSANKVSKTGLNSHAEEILAEKNSSFTDVPCGQPVRASVSGIGEVVAREEALDDVQHQLTAEQNNQFTVGPFSESGHVSSLGVRQSDKLVNFSREFIHGGVSFDDVVAHELRNNTIFLEGDYLELDDLVGPLLGLDSSG